MAALEETTELGQGPGQIFGQGAIAGVGLGEVGPARLALRTSRAG